MKKWLIGIVVLIGIVYGLNASKERLDDKGPVQSVTDDGAPAKPVAGDDTRQRIGKDEVYKGELLLIDLRNAVPKSERPETVLLSKHPELVQGFGLLDDSIELPKAMLDRFTPMVEAAREDGVRHLVINSAYRDVATQASLYERLGSVYANPPGHSEHNLGLSLDLGSSQGPMKDSPEGVWLRKNAWKFGFILRYPEDKTDITGVIYEPWHFRYVGLPHSAIMQEHGFVLEQYLDYLKDRQQVSTVVNGTEYEVSYYPMDGDELQIPVKEPYQISGNNMDGVIVTTWSGDASNQEGKRPGGKQPERIQFAGKKL